LGTISHGENNSRQHFIAERRGAGRRGEWMRSITLEIPEEMFVVIEEQAQSKGVEPAQFSLRLCVEIKVLTMLIRFCYNHSNLELTNENI
jgi:hypothetical protein